LSRRQVGPRLNRPRRVHDFQYQWKCRPPVLYVDEKRQNISVYTDFHQIQLAWQHGDRRLDLSLPAVETFYVVRTSGRATTETSWRLMVMLAYYNSWITVDNLICINYCDVSYFSCSLPIVQWQRWPQYSVADSQ